VEFGSGVGFAEMKGSEASDPFALRNDRVVTLANHNGGVNGGISNGMPVILRTAYKPVSSIGKPQKTISFEKMEESIRFEKTFTPVKSELLDEKYKKFNALYEFSCNLK
jgi:chorismate synthase